MDTQHTSKALLSEDDNRAPNTVKKSITISVLECQADDQWTRPQILKVQPVFSQVLTVGTISK